MIKMVNIPTRIKDAIWDRKFDYVLLTDSIHPEENLILRDILLQRDYSLKFNEAYFLSSVMTKNITGNISFYARNKK